MANYNPISKNGIPELKFGSSEFMKFWNKELDRCKNGYKPTNGEWIPGSYYFYLNYCSILSNKDGSSRKSLNNPDYRDQDHEYFSLVNQAKEEGKGLIVLKARDKGFSYMNSGLALWEWTFFPNNEIGIGAPTPSYVSAMRTKITNMWNDLPNEFKLRKDLKDNERTMMSGYQVKEKGVWIEKGNRSIMHFRTMDNPDMFRGERLAMMILDEAGEFKKLIRAYMASQACFMDGAVQFGVPIIGGTSNTMRAGNDDFMELFYEYEKYNLLQLFIPASKVYHGFFNTKTGESDEIGASEDIELKRERLKGGKDKSAYYLYVQEYPLTPEDAFMSTNKSLLDLESINNQRALLLANDKYRNMVSTGDLVWVSETSDVTKNLVQWVPNPDGKLQILYHPEHTAKYLDIGGVDSYYQEDSKTSDSKGACIIYRRFSGTDMPGELPVCMYNDRPYTKEEFYDTCLKMAVYYNSELLVEYTDELFFKYFENRNALKYLKKRPKAADSPWSRVSNRFGVHMKSYQKNMITELLDDYVKKNCDSIMFLDILDDLSVYGFKNTDLAMAFGLCLMHDLDNAKIMVRHAETEELGLHIPHFTRVGGLIKPIN